MPPGSRLRIKMDAMVTSEALKYQLYSSAKIQWDTFEAPWDLYNPKLLLNLNDQGYTMEDVKFPTMELETKGFANEENMCEQQINTSSLLAELGIPAVGQNENNGEDNVKRKFMAMFLIMYYQTIKEYYANKQEGIGYMIHAEQWVQNIISVTIFQDGSDTGIPEEPGTILGVLLKEGNYLDINITYQEGFQKEKVEILIGGKRVS